MIGRLDDDADSPVALHTQNTRSAEGTVPICAQMNRIGSMGMSCIVVYKVTFIAVVSVLEWVVLTCTVNTFVPA